MARPLPKDVEQQIAGMARRSEARSVGVMGFMLGIACGVGIGASFVPADSGSLFFLIGAGGVAALWLFAALRRKQQ
ncbi:hypothetical protein [Kordiimonas aquimaris]|uniref:hypothetical protein n=1 Tax=Kordiimonas aquimaris TaxID=707591 RepID=UPI0021D0B10B|nr:hypothetical protein [Kordiimonas aquimaris]